MIIYDMEGYGNAKKRLLDTSTKEIKPGSITRTLNEDKQNAKHDSGKDDIIN